MAAKGRAAYAGRTMVEQTYSDRKGYDPSFLRPGASVGRVFLPTLSAKLAKQAVPLLADARQHVLRYHHYSVVMHRTRRFAIYSAANVDYRGRTPMRRPSDVWLADPRIAESAQVTGAFYEHNQFDRGHLTRREDLEFGSTPASALASAADTCHWTNCTPQHARFNESAQLWQGLEKHILEKAVVASGFRAQVITGPVFDAHDPVLQPYADTPYPLRYWKVVAAIDAAGRLFATAYVLDQRDVIAKYGTRGVPEVPFTGYKTYQTTIAEVQRLTGLAFTGGTDAKPQSLRLFDPLAKRGVTRSPLGAVEAVLAQPYLELRDIDDVVMRA